MSLAILDTGSYVAIDRTGTSSYEVLPAMQLAATDDPAVRPVFMVGNASFESVNFIRGLSQPAVQFLGIPHRQWFTAANLTNMFTNRLANTGFLAPLNSIAYVIGPSAGGLTDQVLGCFSKCYAAGMTLSGGGRGMPVTAAMGLLPCGTAQSIGGITLDKTAIEGGGDGLFQSDGVTFGSYPLTDVEGWTLTVTNSMTPDTTVPGTASPDATVKIYPADYLSGPVGIGLTLLQRAGGVHGTNIIDAASLAVVNPIQIVLHSVEVTSGNRVTVTITLQGLKPAKSSAVRIGSTLISRTYVGQATFTGGTPVSKIAFT